MNDAGRYLFVSYRSIEAAFPLRLAADLRNGGVSIWLDRLEGIKPGKDWRRSIERAVDGCAAMIAVLSPEYVASTYCQNELARADDEKKPVIPILLRDLGRPPPIELQRIQYVDFTSWEDEAVYAGRFAQLMGVLGEHAGEQLGEPPDPEHRYLTSLIASLEANRGVEQYVDLLGGVFERTERREPVRPAVDRVVAEFGLDPEFSLLTIEGGTKCSEAPVYAEPRRVASVSEAATDHPRLVILGEPGAGKTTTLRRLALGAARKRAADPRGSPLPLYLELPRWTDPATPEDFVRAHWPFETDAVEALTTGAAELYLDALNEMGDRGTAKAKSLKAWMDGASGPQRVILTCRKDDYAGDFVLDLPVVLTEPLDEGRIRRLAANFLGEEDAQQFVDRIFERDLRTLAANPYLLTIMLVVGAAVRRHGDGVEREASTLPHNKGTLFRTLSEYLWKRERIRKTPGWVPYEEAEPRFASLAFTMIDEGLPIDVSREVVRQHLGKDDALLRLGVSANLLRADGDEVRFYHQLIQESFAAVRLLQEGLGDRIPALSFVGRSFIGPESDRRVGKWDEVVIAACGIADDPGPLLRETAATDPALACDCIRSGAFPSAETGAAIALELNERIRIRDRAIESASAALEKHNMPPMAYDRIESVVDRAEWEKGYFESRLSQLRDRLRTR